MKFYYILIAIVLFFTSCTKREKQNESDSAVASNEVIMVTDAQLPLYLKDIVFDSATMKADTNRALYQLVNELTSPACIWDTTGKTTAKPARIGVLRMQDSLRTLYLVVLKECPIEFLGSYVLVYDHTSKQFLKEPWQFKIYNLYNIEPDRLTPNNLKTVLKIDGPDVDRANNGYKFTRLWHNGTFNMLHTTVMKVGKERMDTLSDETLNYSIEPYERSVKHHNPIP